MASTATRRRPKRPICPFCGYDDQVVPIMYGLPGPELIEQSQRGDVALGGCCIGPDSHNWYCKGCLRSFNASVREEESGFGKAAV
jgi:hypothetical protein